MDAVVVPIWRHVNFQHTTKCDAYYGREKNCVCFFLKINAKNHNKTSLKYYFNDWRPKSQLITLNFHQNSLDLYDFSEI